MSHDDLSRTLASKNLILKLNIFRVFWKIFLIFRELKCSIQVKNVWLRARAKSCAPKFLKLSEIKNFGFEWLGLTLTYKIFKSKGISELCTVLVLYRDCMKLWELSPVYACHCLLCPNSPAIQWRFCFRNVEGCYCDVGIYFSVGCGLLNQLVHAFVALDDFMRLVLEWYQIIIFWVWVWCGQTRVLDVWGACIACKPYRLCA